jgi:hypothetical protein
MTALHQNIATYLNSGSAPCTNAARGGYAAGIGLNMRAVDLKHQGALIDIIVPTDGVSDDLEGMAIVKGGCLAACRFLGQRLPPTNYMANSMRCSSCQPQDPKKPTRRQRGKSAAGGSGAVRCR